MLIYDIEIVNAIPVKRKGSEIGIEYCEGWHDHKNMGISCIGVYDYESERYRIFLKDNFDQLNELIKLHNVIVGFNNIRFDNCVMAENGFDLYDLIERSYDILQEIWISVGLSGDFSKAHGGYGLDDVCKANFGIRKTGNGALAPILWQQGKHGEVIDYCLNDVYMTKRLLDRIITTGSIKNPKHPGKLINIERP